MSMQMRAAVYKKPRSLDIEDVSVPEAGSRDLLIRVGNRGICGSDVHSYEAGMYICPGQVMGHEFTGVAETVGSEIEGIEAGDRVTGFDLGGSDDV